MPVCPVRCYTCGKVLANKWNAYENMSKNGVSNEEIFSKLCVKRYCCKTILMTHVNLIDKLLEYEDPEHNFFK